ncbi:hypothetical protein KY284_001492 [Solanum tuberosum]|nr:hypothetical protein KY284_001492 [Solanum tuberosum]
MKILSFIPLCCQYQNPLVPRHILATHLSLYLIKLLNKCVHIPLHTLSLQGHYQIFQLHPSSEQPNHTNAPSTVPPPAPPQIEHVPSTDPPEHLPPSTDSFYPTISPSNTSRHHMVV